LRLFFALLALVSLLFFVGCVALTPEQKAARDKFETDLAEVNVFISRVSQKIIVLTDKYKAGELTLAEFTETISQLYAEKEGLLANKEKIIGDIEELGKQGVPWYYMVGSLITTALSIWKMVQYKGATDKLMLAGNTVKPFKVAVADLGDTFINKLAEKKFPKHRNT